jgi:hypothetical protein
MMFISIDPSPDAARSVAAAGTTRTGCRRLVRSRQMTGGKGAKGGNLESLGNTGTADDVAKRRKPAETGGNSFLGPYGGAKVFLGVGIGPPRRAVGDWRIACGNCGNPHDESHLGLASARNLRNLRNLRHLRAGNPPAPIAVRKNSRSPQSAPAQYRVVPLLGRRDSAAPGRGPRCLTGVGAAPILPHRKNGLKSRKDKAF